LRGMMLGAPFSVDTFVMGHDARSSTLGAFKPGILRVCCKERMHMGQQTRPRVKAERAKVGLDPPLRSDLLHNEASSKQTPSSFPSPIAEGVRDPRFNHSIVAVHKAIGCLVGFLDYKSVVSFGILFLTIWMLASKTSRILF
jgi:hypothetical protein